VVETRCIIQRFGAVNYSVCKWAEGWKSRSLSSREKERDARALLKNICLRGIYPSSFWPSEQAFMHFSHSRKSRVALQGRFGDEISLRAAASNFLK